MSDARCHASVTQDVMYERRKVSCMSSTRLSCMSGARRILDVACIKATQRLLQPVDVICTCNMPVICTCNMHLGATTAGLTCRCSCCAYSDACLLNHARSRACMSLPESMHLKQMPHCHSSAHARMPNAGANAYN